ncbi:hypothetical protein [Vibrio sonorensis]|uniref:hypothetical protein n=1 Tax=Vibrio sonorensis TaxID=1004316 RepID=UPI0008DA6FC5|nr:hypothetical protein [Vibrio sonorensis]
MAKPFNAYSPAITATEKAIKDREAKLAELQEAEAIWYSQAKSTDFYYQLGRVEAAIDLKIGDQKAANTKLKKMVRLEKLISNVGEDYDSILNKCDSLNSEIDLLKSVASLLSIKSISTNQSN